ncbi:hypothetical protein SLE2022_387900 [Rubroshorea leprosula]
MDEPLLSFLSQRENNNVSPLPIPITASSLDPLLQQQRRSQLHICPQSSWLVDPNYKGAKSNLHRSKTAPALAEINEVTGHPAIPKRQSSSQSIRAISYLLRTVKHEAGKKDPKSYIIDVKKGRIRIRMKVGLALGVVILCIGIGVGGMHFVEKLGWLDAFYLSVMSVTTVGYGDRAFKTLPDRIFASIWLLVSTLAVARAFLYLAEARADKRHRKTVKWVLGQDMTVSEFLAADIDKNGFVEVLVFDDGNNKMVERLAPKGCYFEQILLNKSEYVIYKLKEMGKVLQKDIPQICQKFDRLDAGKNHH